MEFPFVAVHRVAIEAFRSIQKAHFWAADDAFPAGVAQTSLIRLRNAILLFNNNALYMIWQRVFSPFHCKISQ
jgi:hypothetical protein